MTETHVQAKRRISGMIGINENLGWADVVTLTLLYAGEWRGTPAWRVLGVRPTCGCTPPIPWRLAAVDVTCHVAALLGVKTTRDDRLWVSVPTHLDAAEYVACEIVKAVDPILDKPHTLGVRVVDVIGRQISYYGGHES